jgi:chromosome segregation ATPase
MAGRPGLDPTEEGKSYSALFVLMVAVLLVSAVWSIWDDNISRRPWKQYQVQWDHLAYDKYMHDAADEQKRLDADPEYQKAAKGLAEAQKELQSGATASKLADLRSQLVALNVAADDKDQLVRFTKSFLTERWYDYNHAVQEKQDPAQYKAEIARRAAELAQENLVSDKAKANLQAVKDQIEALNSKVDSLTEQLKKLTAKRDDFFDKADSWMIPI